MDENILILVVSFLIVLVMTGMIAFMVSGSKARQKARIMNVIKGGAAADTAKGKDPRDARREALAKKLKEKGIDEKKDGKISLSLMLQQAGLNISVRQYWIFSVLFAVAATFLVYASGKSLFVVVMTAIIGFFGAPKLALRFLAKRRQKKFLTDMADALEAMTRLLRAGMPVSEAIKMIGREYAGPIGEEMGRIFDQQKVGVSLPEAVLDSARRIPIPEMKMFATAVAIQAQTGSSLSEILEGLARVIRARFRLRRKVQALSSEAKSSAAIIGSLPFIVAGALWAINPDYIGLLFFTHTGKWLMAGCGFWMLCGILVMRQMINFRI